MVNLDYLYNPEAAKPYFDKNHFVDKKLGFQVIEKGIVLPHKTFNTGKWNWGGGGIINENGEFIKNSPVHSDTGGMYTPPPKSIRQSSETVIYLGLWFPVWGHAITDNIRRLWFLKSDDFKSNFKNCPLVYIPWKNNPLENQQNFKRLLEILDIDVSSIRPITQPTRFDKIILADESFYLDGYRKFTIEYRETIDCLRNFALKNCTPTSSRKVYYFYGKDQMGEERLAEYFRSKGYEIISPEKLTFDEQLNWLINCESFATSVGSISHNMIFLRDNTETILIPRSFNLFMGYQQCLDQVHPININYVDSTFSMFNKGHDSYCFIISEQLKRFFGDKWKGYEDEDFKTFLDYVNSSVRKGRTINPGIVRGYGSFFIDFMEQLKQRKDLIATYDMPPRWKTFQPLLSYQTHVHLKGWVAWVSENQISGSTENNLDIQAIKINFPNHKIYYSVYFNDKEGWSEEVLSPEMAGTTGKSKSIYGIRIRLDEAGAKEFDILYRVHKFDGEWTNWAKNDEALYSDGIKLNAIQIKFEPVTTQPAKETQKQPVKETPKQPAKETPKQPGKETPKQSPKETPKQPSDILTVLMGNNAEIYLQVQRQDLTQIKL